MLLNYTLQADISGAALGALLAHVLRQIQRQIDHGVGENRVGPPPGYLLVEEDELGLEMHAADIVPWVLTWRHLFDLVELVRYCFQDKRVFFEFKANVWIGDVFREIIDVQIWKGGVGDIEIF